MFPADGFRDIGRQVRLIWLFASRMAVRRSIYLAETELGFLGWQQADYFDERISEEVKKVQEFENTQASLLNTSAELGERKRVLDEEFAKEKAAHDQAQAGFDEERKKASAELERLENARREKREVVERFEQAIAELTREAKQLEERSLSFMKIEDPNFADRREATEVSGSLKRIEDERKLVLADQAKAAQETGKFDPDIDRMRAEIERVDTAAEEARARFGEAEERFNGETRELERQRRESQGRITHLDREKRKPYRAIGACLADSGISSFNQPAALEKVLALRRQEAGITQTIAQLHAESAAMHPAAFVAFYLLLAAAIFGLCILLVHYTQ